jgi:hypothetical protein
LDSTFSDRNYGAGSFRDFAQKLEKAGVLRVHQGKGGWLVAPAEGMNLSDSGAVEADARTMEPAAAPGRPPAAAEPAAPVPVLGTPMEGISEMARIIGASDVRKWPLYLRMVKQILRSQTPPFDERAYGFPSLVDLLRAAHKEGAFRVERDRQGVIRVFQSGSAGLRPQTPQSEAPEASPDEVEAEAATATSAEAQPLVEVPAGEADTAKPAKHKRAPRKPRATAAKRPAKTTKTTSKQPSK